MFGNLFSNEAVKKTLLKQFVKHCKENNIKRILINVEGDEMTFEPLNDEVITVLKKDYEFYKNEYFKTLNQ